MEEGEKREFYGKARRDLSAVGLTMVIGSVLFIGVQYLAALLYQLAAGDSVEYDINIVLLVELIPTYLFTMPFTIYLLKRLPGVTIPKRRMGFWPFLGAVACVFGVMISCNIVGLILTALIGSVLGESVQNQAAELLTGLNPTVSLVIVSIAAPIFEELIFRKMLVTRTLRYGEGVAIFLSGLMFGLFHGNLNQFMYAFGLGMLLAFLYIRTGDIRVTIGLHMIVNFSSSVLGTMLLKKLYSPELLEMMSAGDRAAMTGYMLEHLGAFFLVLGYLALEYGLALLGIILLIVNYRKLALRPMKKSLEKGDRLSVIFGNIGIPLFCAIWVVMIVMQLLGLR